MFARQSCPGTLALARARKLNSRERQYACDPSTDVRCARCRALSQQPCASGMTRRRTLPAGIPEPTSTSPHTMIEDLKKKRKADNSNYVKRFPYVRMKNRIQCNPNIGSHHRQVSLPRITLKLEKHSRNLFSPAVKVVLSVTSISVGSLSCYIRCAEND